MWLTLSNRFHFSNRKIYMYIVVDYIYIYMSIIMCE